MTDLIDCHAHLHDDAFDADRYDVIDRAARAGVAAIVTAGTDLATSIAAVLLAEHESRVYATTGIHPHESAAAKPGDLDRLAQLAASERVVAIGEIGLDYHFDHSPHPIQRQWLATQLELADRLMLPVVVHSRDADADTFAILRDWSAGRKAAGMPNPYGLMHCYSYGAERSSDYLDLGLMISIPGIVTYPRAEFAQLTATTVPIDALVVETDCPYLAPQSRRGRRNEPALVVETADKLAAVRGLSLDQVAAQTTQNARSLFRLPDTRVNLQGAGDTSEPEPQCRP